MKSAEIIDGLIESIEGDLVRKKKELVQRQDSIKLYMENSMNYTTFEQNVIQDLLVTKDLKASIREMENLLAKTRIVKGWCE